MHSILEKALVALLNEDKERADKLFHDFVLERSRQIHESIRQGEDFVLDEAMENIAVEDMFSVDLEEGKTFKHGDDDEEDADEKKKQDQKRREEKKSKNQPVEEGKSFKHNDDDEDEADDKKKQDRQKRDAQKSKKQPLEESSNEAGYQFYVVANGKIESGWDYAEDAGEHRSENMPSNLRKGAKIFKLAGLRNLGLDPADDASWLKQSEMNEGKSFKHDDEDDEEGSDAKKKQDRQKRDAQKNKKQPVEEGRLEVTQGDDGTLSLTHTPEASVDLPVDAVVGGTGEISDVSDASQDFDMELDSQVGDDLSDESDEALYASLGESLADELERIAMPNKDGAVAVGSPIKQERHSPTPNNPVNSRADTAKPAVITGTEHNGFDLETTPKTVTNTARSNTFAKAEDSRQPASKEGNSGALLNQIGDDKTAKSPIGGK